MATTSGNMKSFKVTDKDGNIFVMTPVDTEARQAIDEAKNLYFDEDYFTSEVSQDETEVAIGLNGVPIGVDTDTPLEFVQDDENGIVLGSKAPFATSIADEFTTSSTYDLNDKVMYKGNFYICTSAISTTGNDWDISNWSATNVESEITNLSAQLGNIETALNLIINGNNS